MINPLTCSDRYKCMAFAQLTCRLRPRDIETCLRARANRLRHVCIRSSVAGNMLSNTNNVRDWRLHAVFTHHLIHKAGNPYREDWRFLRICQGLPRHLTAPVRASASP